MVYTDRTNSVNNADTDIYVVHSDNNGSTWTGKIRVNKDSTTTSQFFPRIAVDQTTGKVAVSWYDCRADTAKNEKTQFYAAVSSDGGTTFSASNLLLESPNQSDSPVLNSNDCFSYGYNGLYDYWDYTGLAYYGGYFYSAWADNSTNAPGNLDGSCGTDIVIGKAHF
jgi:hypothetical protein